MSSCNLTKKERDDVFYILPITVCFAMTLRRVLLMPSQNWSQYENSKFEVFFLNHHQPSSSNADPLSERGEVLLLDCLPQALTHPALLQVIGHAT